MARNPKRSRDSSGPENFKEVLTNTKTAIFKGTYPEDKLTEHDQDNILEELRRMLHGTPIGEQARLKSYILEGGALTYICADQQSGQWLRSKLHIVTFIITTFRTSYLNYSQNISPT
jgi:hypothetical protein